MFFLFLHLYDMTRTSGANLPNLPYKDHPLYKLRRLTIITALVGIILNLFAVAALVDDDSYDVPPFVVAIVILLISFIFVLHDLISYASALLSARSSLPIASPHASSSTSRVEEQKPNWPSKRLIVTDLILALIFQWLFWIVFGTIMRSFHRYSYRSGVEMAEAYANLANLSASILHGIAFWKEVIARKQQAWQKQYEITRGPCENCGHTRPVIDVPEGSPMSNHGEADQSGSATATAQKLGKGKGKQTVILPKWARGPDAGRYADDHNVVEHAGAKTVVEEPLLVTPEDSTADIAGPSDYGTMGQSVDSISSVPETVVKKKDKGKKRLVEVD